MPRDIAINETPNPTHLSMHDREVAIDVVRSLQASIHRARTKERNSFFRREWTAEDEQRITKKVVTAALKQLCGRQQSEGGLFRLDLHINTDVSDEDMAYVLRSLRSS